MFESRKLIDLIAWVAAARGDKALHRRRQVTRVVIWSVANTPTLSNMLYLKGGTLMALAYGSPRNTADIDFTAATDEGVEAVNSSLKATLTTALDRAPVLVGYPELICRIQRWRRRPREAGFEGSEFPAIEASVGSALRGSREMARLDAGQAMDSVPIDISFREPIVSATEFGLAGATGQLHAYDQVEVIAEKLRALLQQVQGRRRHVRQRRQDVYDIAFLSDAFPPDIDTRARLRATLKIKCEARGFSPDATAFDDPELKVRAQDGWETLETEVGDLPDFESRFEVVRRLYCALPWR